MRAHAQVLGEGQLRENNAINQDEAKEQQSVNI